MVTVALKTVAFSVVFLKDPSVARSEDVARARLSPSYTKHDRESRTSGRKLPKLLPASLLSVLGVTRVKSSLRRERGQPHLPLPNALEVPLLLGGIGRE